MGQAPIELADAVAELRSDDFLGANVTIPHKERVVPLVDRLTEDAHATGAVNTITREGKRLVGHNTDVPGFKQALDKLVGRQKMPRQAVVFGAGGGSRAVIHGLITAGFLRIVVFNRHLHRAETLVKFFGKSAAHMELKAMPWHESIIEAELAEDEDPGQRDLDRPARRRVADPGRDHPARPAGPRPDLPAHEAAAGRGLERGDGRRRGDDAPPPGRGRVQPVDGPAGTARGDGAALTAARAGGIESAEGEPTGVVAEA